MTSCDDDFFSFASVSCAAPPHLLFFLTKIQNAFKRYISRKNIFFCDQALQEDILLIVDLWDEFSPRDQRLHAQQYLGWLMGKCSCQCTWKDTIEWWYTKQWFRISITASSYRKGQCKSKYFTGCRWPFGEEKWQVHSQTSPVLLYNLTHVFSYLQIEMAKIANQLKKQIRRTLKRPKRLHLFIQIKNTLHRKRLRRRS